MKKRIKSFGYAINGIRIVIGSEVNMKIHLGISLAVIVLGIGFMISPTEWLICLLCMGLVAGLEMMNTAIEKLVDLVSPHQNPQAGVVKDIAAGAVLIGAILSATIGTIIFAPKVWVLINWLINWL